MEVRMIELPMSAFMRNYYRELGVTFTDSEQATIIWNSNLPRGEALSALQEIANATKDETLKTQIQERLDKETKTERFFVENDDRYFFVFVPDDEDEWDGCYFAALTPAIAYGKDHSKETFKILKQPFSDKLSVPAAENDSDETYIGVQAKYTKDGVLLSCDCYTEENLISLLHPYPSRFEDAYVPLQSPFERGDIVRIEGDSRPAIVLVSQAEWKRNLERCANELESALFPSYGNTSLTVEFLDDDGQMYHEHPCILSLEKIDHWDDELEWELLQAASRLVKGDGSLDDFLCSYHQNLNRKEKK